MTTHPTLVTLKPTFDMALHQRVKLSTCLSVASLADMVLASLLLPADIDQLLQADIDQLLPDDIDQLLLADIDQLASDM